MKLLEHRTGRYGLALLAVALSALLRWLMPDVLSRAPYLGFYPAVVVAAALGGVWPGLLATFGSLLLVNLVFIQFNFFDYGLQMRNVVWIAGGIGVSVLAGRLLEARQRVERTQEWLRVTLTSIGDAVMTADTKGRVTFLNPVAEAVTGWKAEEAQGQPIQSVFHIINEQTGEPTEDIVGRVLGEGKTFALANHTALITKDEREVPIEDSAAPIRDSKGKVVGVVLVFHDVTEKRRKEEQLRRLTRTLKALNNSNQALLHAADEAALLEQVCKIVTEDCGHAMVWIGFAEEDEGKSVRPVAHAGFEEGYLETLQITWADTERGRGLTGTAIRTGKPCSCRNMLTDHQFAPWRAEALKRGYASSLVLPLMADGRAFGAITIYASEADAFAEDEVKLLLELTADLAYGIGTLRARAARERAEKALRESEERLRMQMERMPIGCIVFDEHNRVSQLNPAAERIFGYSAAELRGQHVNIIVPEAVRSHVNGLLRRLGEGHMTAHSVNENVTKDGRIIMCQWTNTPLRDAAGGFIGFLSMVQDITERKRAEEALRQSETRYRELVQNANSAILRWSRDGTITFLNEYAQQVFGWSADEAIGKPVGILVPERESTGADLTGLIRDILEHPQRYVNVTNENVCRDGRRVWMSWTNRAIRDERDNVAEILAIGNDVTERKRAEEELRRAEEELREAQRLAHVGNWYWDTNTDITTGSDEFFRIYGLDPTGRQMSAFKEKRGRLYPPEEWERLNAAMQRTLQTGVGYELDVQVIRDRAKIWITTRSEAVRNADGKIVGLRGTVHDITERKRAEARLRRFYETDLFAILYWKIDGGVGEVNDRFLEMTGYTREDLRTGRLNWAEMTPPEYHAMDEDARRQIRETGVHLPYEKQFIRKDGTRVWGLFSAAAWEDNREEGVSFILDITERKRAEEALLRSERLAAVGRMSASIAHEINNPLAAVMNTIFLAQTNADEPDSVRQYLDLADDELKRISHITRQTLGFYRESSRPTTVSVNSVLDSAVDLLRGKIRVKGATIEKQYDGDLQITVVPGELRQVFSNLLANSLDAMNQKGTIKLRVSKSPCINGDQPSIRITVADNGNGIDAAVLPRIFEPLFTTKEATGSGLGLWVSKQLVDKHGGVIRVRSSTREPRRGTVFSIFLPTEGTRGN